MVFHQPWSLFWRFSTAATQRLRVRARTRAVLNILANVRGPVSMRVHPPSCLLATSGHEDGSAVWPWAGESRMRVTEALNSTCTRTALFSLCLSGLFAHTDQNTRFITQMTSRWCCTFQSASSCGDNRAGKAKEARGCSGSNVVSQWPSCFTEDRLKSFINLI